MSTGPSFNPRQLAELYVRGATDAISAELLKILDYFDQGFLPTLDANTQRGINMFVLQLLHYFSQADYVPSKRDALRFIRLNQTIANMVALTPVKTTDAYLEIIRSQQNNLGKLLALYSARNRMKFDRQQLFATNPVLASVWYAAYGGMFHGGLQNPEVLANLQEHYHFAPPVIQTDNWLPDVYYGSSYVDGVCDRPVKTAVNRCVQAELRRTPLWARPNPRKLAVISSLWWPAHSVYRNYAAYVESLKDDYELTLFHIPIDNHMPVADHFKEIVQLKVGEGKLNLSPLENNEFAAVYFPDIGMTVPSIMLANLRIAPIQFAGLGHSVSTFGAEMDYFISGADVEIPENPEKNYSERLVLLPGYGVIHERMQYQPVGRTKTVPEFVLNCPWTGQKINRRLCELLFFLVRQSRKPLRFRLFLGASLARHASYLPFIQDMKEFLAPAIVEPLPGMQYDEYMATMEEGDLTLDAFHYGGCNTVIDSLLLRKPMVTLEGERWYNRIGPRMLRDVGEADLVATSGPEYVQRALHLIHDDAYREACAARLRALDLDATVFSRADARYFRKAVDYLIAHHDRLRREPDRTPIRIERD